MSYKEYTLKIHDNGACEYFNKAGQRHREDGPAIECTNGYKAWYLNGWRHREDGPAVEEVDGAKFWYLNGQLLTEAEFLAKTQSKTDCDGKVVEIDGKKYKLVLEKG